MDAPPRSLRLILAALGTTLLIAAPAAAQSPVPTPTPPPPPPPPAPAPVAGALAVAPVTPYKDGRRLVALRGDKVTIAGTLTPYVAGQVALVRAKVGRRTVLKRQLPIVAGPAGAGTFAVRLHVGRTGWLRIQATHTATPQLVAARSRPARLLVVRPSAGYGSRGAVVRMLQRGLRALRYQARVTGVFDAATARAVLAWRKVNHRARLYSADSTVVRRVLAGQGGWKVRHPTAGRHVEADISLQALALIDGNRVVAVLPTSSGKPSTPTVLGTFHFYLKTPGVNSEGMVDSNYFIGGYAIHGYADVPTYNASHGCLRIPIPDAARVYAWIHVGDTIFVER